MECGRRVLHDTEMNTTYRSLRMKYSSLLFTIGLVTTITASTITASTARAGDSETVWFVVSETDIDDKNDSYLLPLSDPAAIAMARQLIDEGPGGAVGSIATVRIAAGSDGFNRNILAPGEPLWSWHVTAFEGFSDFAIELCDGWPGFVEEDVEGFIRNTNATICFWGYTVTAELAEPPGYRVSDADRGTWFNPETAGQGILLDIIGADVPQMFAAWFTFAADSTSKVGAGDQRWLTAQGDVRDGSIELAVSNTTGGRFDASDPVTTMPAGTLTLTFDHCNQIRADYSVNDGADNETGSFTMTRLQPRMDCEPSR